MIITTDDLFNTARQIRQLALSIDKHLNTYAILLEKIAEGQLMSNPIVMTCAIPGCEGERTDWGDPELCDDCKLNQDYDHLEDEHVEPIDP